MSDLNLRHLMHLIAVCDNGYSVSLTASKLNVAQSVVSRNIHALEKYFGTDMFVRHGRRLVGPTPLCSAMIDSLRDIGMRVDSLQIIAESTLNQPVSGEIRIACTHLQARYVLPEVIGKVLKRYPDVKVSIHQGFPTNINDMVMSNSADLGICSENLCDSQSMVTVDAFSWHRVLIAPQGHPILDLKRITIKRLAEEPIITYATGITGRRQFDETFVGASLYPNVVVSAADSDVIKEFTRRGHGIGIISEIAYEPKFDSDLVPRCMPGLFKPMVTRVVHRHDRMLSSAQGLFIEEFCEVSENLAMRCHEEVA